MDNEEIYEPDLLSVTDEDGNEIVFELLEPMTMYMLQ